MHHNDSSCVTVYVFVSTIVPTLITYKSTENNKKPKIYFLVSSENCVHVKILEYPPDYTHKLSPYYVFFGL